MSFDNLIFVRYSVLEDYTEPPIPTTTFPTTSTAAASASASSSSSSSSTTGPTLTSTVQYNTYPPNVNGTATSTSKTASRKGGIIFPSVKNKPSVVNTTFATDILSFKDVKVFRNISYLFTHCTHRHITKTHMQIQC